MNAKGRELPLQPPECSYGCQCLECREERWEDTQDDVYEAAEAQRLGW